MDLNYIAIFLAGFVAFAIGALWYSPVMFGKPWMALTGMKPEDAKKAGMWKYYSAGLISYMLMAYVLAWFIPASAMFMETQGKEMGAMANGAMTGFWMWLGFVATMSLGGVLWEKKPLKLYFLNNAYSLVALLVMGAILGGWR